MLMSEFFRAVFAILSCERKCNLVVNLQRKPFNYCSHGKVVCNSIVMDCHPLSGSLAYENVKDFKVIWRTFEHIHAAKLHITFFNFTLLYTIHQFWIFLQYFFDNNKLALSISSFVSYYDMKPILRIHFFYNSNSADMVFQKGKLWAIQLILRLSFLRWKQPCLNMCLAKRNAV